MAVAGLIFLRPVPLLCDCPCSECADDIHRCVEQDVLFGSDAGKLVLTATVAGAGAKGSVVWDPFGRVSSGS